MLGYVGIKAKPRPVPLSTLVNEPLEQTSVLDYDSEAFPEVLDSLFLSILRQFLEIATATEASLKAAAASTFFFLVGFTVPILLRFALSLIL